MVKLPKDREGKLADAEQLVLRFVRTVVGKAPNPGDHKDVIKRFNSAQQPDWVIQAAIARFVDQEILFKRIITQAVDERRMK